MSQPPASASRPRSDPGTEVSYPGRWIALYVMLAANFMNLIDVTIVNVALPSLQRDLGASDTAIEWVAAAYILFYAVGLLPFGRLGDMLGRRTMFLAGVSCFTIASAVCGLAPSIGWLVVARIFQGISAAMMTPQTLAIAQIIFAPRERGSALSMFGLTAGMATVTGPLLGGVLIGLNIFDLTWRPVFLVNIPVGLVTLGLALRYLPKGRGRRDVGIDGIGIMLAMLTVVLIVFPLVEGRNFGWPLWIFAMLAASLPSAYAFARWQIASAGAGRPQLMPASVLRNPQFMTGAVMTTLLFSSIPGLFLVLAIFLQVGFGLTPLQSGLTTIPFSVGVLLASLLANRLASRWPRRRVIIGGTLQVIGMIYLRYVIGAIDGGLNTITLLPPLLIGGLGLGTTIPALFQTVLANVEGKDAGSASGSLQAFQQAGAALGVAVMGQIFFAHFAGQASAAPPALFIEALRAALVYSIAVFAVVVAGGVRYRYQAIR
ncbi:MFS transporter [Pseudohoeflea coraliihabitans]|uniref:MFS transporter n=1 Tax=Pseudohoeflea coraliihabitans TaxID=2860393 RepID=A0ABS6WMA3_9HYPH|nr:MFS transporter [Pseudohoeflea sp. DP4N28-3]MBW3097078.1 MFS transporter [Pseudohoeflea sp. DP4N28-3]